MPFGSAERAHQVLQSWPIPTVNSGAVNVEARLGQATLVVGANGSGKSALSHWLETHTEAPVRRLIAHRRVWFDAPGPSINSAQREQARPNLRAWSSQPESRWLDHADGVRTSIVLFDLLAQENGRNAEVARLVDLKADHEEIARLVLPSLLGRLNTVLARGQLPVRLEVTHAGGLDAIANGVHYPIHQMSDGEKAAVLLAAEVLTCESRSVQILDEPERHLHRSISAPLIESLMQERPDCHFVLVTHDLGLTQSSSFALSQFLVLTGCSWSGTQAVAWDLEVIAAGSSLPDVARRAVLGGRRQLLFVEGQPASLDLGLYGLLFPEHMVQPVGSCEQVIRAVTGLHNSGDLHWIDARGVVDADGRQADEIAALASKGVLVLRLHEVENAYYCLPVLEAVSHVSAEARDEDPAALLASALSAGLQSLRVGDSLKRLAGSAANQQLHRLIAQDLPKGSEMQFAGATIAVQIESPYPATLAAAEAALRDEDWNGLLRLLPVRESGFRDAVAKALHAASHADYEVQVLAALRRDPALRDEVLSIVGDMPRASP